ncbi:MAG: DUF1772 domain-containing protein [Woeseiaceae bacterium]
MSFLTYVAGLTAVLGSALVGGVFFAFSSFVMKALARVPSAEGIAAMQSINVVVINPSFLSAFIGMAILSVGAAAFALGDPGKLSSMLLLGGAVSYFAGTFLVTILANVPLNDQLAAISVGDPDAVRIWTTYLDQWTSWNTVRTVAAIVASVLFTISLLQHH